MLENIFSDNKKTVCESIEDYIKKFEELILKTKVSLNYLNHKNSLFINALDINLSNPSFDDKKRVFLHSRQYQLIKQYEDQEFEDVKIPLTKSQFAERIQNISFNLSSRRSKKNSRLSFDIQ